MILFMSARTVCLCSFIENLAGPFWTKVSPFNDAQTVADLLFGISHLSYILSHMIQGDMGNAYMYRGGGGGGGGLEGIIEACSGVH